MSMVKAPRLRERINPPALSLFSTISGAIPAAVSVWGAAIPDGPAPMISVWMSLADTRAFSGTARQLIAAGCTKGLKRK
jgi:hypothetical protein